MGDMSDKEIDDNEVEETANKRATSGIVKVATNLVYAIHRSIDATYTK